jgi:hypothetical protein
MFKPLVNDNNDNLLAKNIVGTVQLLINTDDDNLFSRIVYVTRKITKIMDINSSLNNKYIRQMLTCMDFNTSFI